MHSFPSSQLVPLINLRDDRFRAEQKHPVLQRGPLRSSGSGVKTFPFQEKRCTNFAIVSDTAVPGATIAVPSPSPSGIAAGGRVAEDLVELFAVEF